MAKHEIKSTLPLFTQLRAGAFTFGLVLTLVHPWHASHGPKVYSFDAFMAEVILILLVGLTEQLIEVNLQLSHGSEGDEGLRYYLLRTRGLLGDLGRKLQLEVVTALRKEDGGFRCCNRHLAIHSYEEFWHLLLERPRNRHVQALHTGEVEVFAPNQKQPMLEVQRQFIEGGGKVARILCYGHAIEGLPAEIKVLATSMLERKIDVYYCDRRRIPQLQKIDWDFLRVTETKDAAIWTLNPSGVIIGASYTNSGEYEGMNFEALWEQIKRQSHVLQLDPATRALICSK